jgi:hypothetical protein
MQRVDYTAPEPYSGDRFESVDVTFCKQDDAAANQAGITAGDIAYFAFNDLQSHNYVYFPDPVDHVTIAKYTRHGLNTTNMNYSINYDDTNTHRPLMKYLIHDRNTYTTSSAAHVLNPEQSGFRRSGIMQLKTATTCQPVSHDSDLIAFGTSVEPTADAPCATWTDHRVGSLYGQTFICTSGVATCGTANDRYSYIVTANTVTK